MGESDGWEFDAGLTGGMLAVTSALSINLDGGWGQGLLSLQSGLCPHLKASELRQQQPTLSSNMSFLIGQNVIPSGDLLVLHLLVSDTTASVFWPWSNQFDATVQFLSEPSKCHFVKLPQ